MTEELSNISMVLFVLMITLFVVALHGQDPLYIYDPFPRPQSSESLAYAEIARMEWYNSIVEDNAEIVFDNFGRCEIGVVDLLSNWEDSGEPHHFLDGMIPCFCGNTTDMRGSIDNVEFDLECALYSSKFVYDLLGEFEYSTSNSTEAVCLEQRYSNIISGVNLSLDAIEHTENMLSMVDGGNASFDCVLAESEIARDLHYQAGRKYSDSSCGTSLDWWMVARRMSVYSNEQGCKLHVLMIEMRNQDLNSSMVIDTNRTLWGFCDD